MRAQEAHDLALALPGRHRGDGRGVGPGLRQSERELLRLLLRLTRDETGIVPWPRATKWLANQTGYSIEAVKLARRRLVRLELVEVLHQGSGLDNGSLYRVDVERIRPVDEVQDHLLPGAVPVHPDEKAVPLAAVGGSPLPPGEVTVTPQGGNGYPPYVRARLSSGFTGSTNPPNPPPASPAGGTGSTTTCTHGRAACRACGTTPRQQAKAARAAAGLATANELKAQQEAARAQRAADEAARLADAADGRSKGYQWAIDHLAEQGVAGFGVSKNQSEQEEAS